MTFQANTDVWGNPPLNLSESWMSAVCAWCIISLNVGGPREDWLELLLVDVDVLLEFDRWKSLPMPLLGLRTMMLGTGGGATDTAAAPRLGGASSPAVVPC